MLKYLFLVLNMASIGSLFGWRDSMYGSLTAEGKTTPSHLILDIHDQKIMSHLSPRTLDRMQRGESLTLSDIIKLSQGGISDRTIIQYMERTRSIYQLSQTQVRRMIENGVSETLVEYMVDPNKTKPSLSD